MEKSNEDKYYYEALDALKALIPESEMWKLKQEYCELEPDFYGFVDIYYSLSKIIPKNMIVIDFGCYMAAQAYFFKDHVQYIGVDAMECDTGLKRFNGGDNVIHYIGTIKEFFLNEGEKLFKENKMENYFAICSYVPDSKQCKIVRQFFPNLFCFYPNSDKPKALEID